MVPVTGPTTTPKKPRRAVIRRHRRERQVIVFGLLLIGVAVAVVIGSAIYRGTIDGPFGAPFNTPQAGFESDVTLVCPPSNTLPLPPDQVGVRVLNGTAKQGLASGTLEDLDGRGFVPLGATNWSRSYAGTARIMFGESGVLEAYTVANQFEGAELVLDTRKNATIDVVLGETFSELRPILAAELDPDVPLSANAPCLPASLVQAEPAPRVVPDDPIQRIAVTESASPSPSPSQ